MNKIQVTKSESAASVISKVLNSPDKEVTVYVPRVSKFAKSRSSFLLLKREIRAAGKDVTVESVDDDVLELAASSGLRSVNPFRGKRQRAVSDMVSVNGSQAEETPVEHEDEVVVKKKGFRGGKEAISKFAPRRAKSILQKDEPSEPVRDLPAESFDEAEEVVDLEVKERHSVSNLKKFLIAVGVTATLTVLATVVIIMLPRVTITLDFDKVEWDFIGELTVSANINENSFSSDEIRLRGVSFLEKKNVTKSYSASGEEFVERKAKGKIIVYNAYSSEPQDLVENTRFRTPDGKVYRTDAYITIPGADVVDGQIVPSSMEVSVTADEAGEDYNIGPIDRYRIPGFQGSPKYDGFYGESKEPMTGGFVGERKVPTEEDIKNAREDVIKTLEDATRSQLFLNIPEDIKVLDGAYRFNVTDEAIDDTTGGTEKFSVTVHGEGRVVGFSEQDLIKVIESRVESETGADLGVRSYNAEYNAPDVGEDGLGFSTALSLESVWAQPFDIDRFKSDASGRDEAGLKALIFSIPGVRSGEVRFWPFWVKKVPEKDGKIIVDVK